MPELRPVLLDARFRLSHDRAVGRRPKSAEDRQRTREAILAAAEAAFQRLGFEGTRIEDVAALAGVATGTVYNYFGGKGDLVLDLHARVDAEANEAIAALVEAPISFEEKLKKYLDGWLVFVERRRWMLPLLAAPHTVRPSARRAGDLYRAMSEGHARHLDLIAAMMAQGIAEGVLHPFPPHDLAMTLFGLAMMMPFKAAFHPGRGVGAAERDLVLRVFLDGARRR